MSVSKASAGGEIPVPVVFVRAPHNKLALQWLTACDPPCSDSAEVQGPLASQWLTACDFPCSDSAEVQRSDKFWFEQNSAIWQPVGYDSG
jgi:hypothetical protein